MDKEAVNAARKEYDRAAECVSIIRTSPDFASVESAWSAFLVADGRIFTKLEQGSKSSTKSQAWWGQKLCQRRKDALLRYLFHARNADEHTIEKIAGPEETKITITEPNPRTVAAMEQGLIGHPNSPILLATEIVFKNLRLMDVFDKGNRYEVPNDHLGAPIKDPIPAVVAGLGLVYLNLILKEADDLIT
jgi:hypothetical protein